MDSLKKTELSIDQDYYLFDAVIKTIDGLVFGFMIELFEEFCANGGTKAIENICSVENIASIAAEAGYHDYKLPLEHLVLLLSPFAGVKNIIERDFCKAFVETIRNSINNWLAFPFGKSTKGVDSSTLKQMEILKRDFFSLRNTKLEMTKETKEQEMLTLISLLNTELLEKKVIAINGIKDLVKESNKGTWLDPPYLTKWILDNHVIGIVLDVNTHSELIKRSAEIFVYLAKHKVLNEAMLADLWNCQQNKHEEIVKEVYEVIISITEHLSLKSIKFLYDQIDKNILVNCNKKTLEFMHDFTLKAFEVSSKSEKIERQFPSPMKDSGNVLVIPKDDCLYFTKRFWELVQDSSPLSGPLLTQALNHFKTLLASSNCEPYRAQYLYLCIENIKQQVSVIQSMELVIRTLNLIDSQRLNEWILSLNKQYRLIELAIESCKHYAELVKEKLNTNENINDCIIGKLKHSVNIKTLFNFLENIIKLSDNKIEVGESNMIKLCDLYMNQYDAEAFLKWISWEKEMKTIQIFDKEETKILFEIVCNSRERLENKFGVLYYDCFANNFVLLNYKLGNMKLPNEKISVVKFENLIGLECLWDCVYYCTNENARAKFSRLLIDIYTNLQGSIEVEERNRVMREFVEKCIKGMTEGEEKNEELGIANYAKLLINLIEFLDGTEYEQIKNTGQKIVLEIDFGIFF